VLYVGIRYFQIAASLVSQLRERVPLADAVPLFTKRLWPGIGVAMEPGSGESFGSHRSRLAAEGLIEAWQRGDERREARLMAVAKRFAAGGLDVARPWLGPGAADQLFLPAAARLS
jgi:HopA1 effector protein family